MSNSPQSKNSDASGKAEQVHFKTSDIGRWASQQESPFARQNRERQAKKQERNKQRQKAAPYIIVISSVIAVGLAVWGLVVLVVKLTNQPEDFNPSTYAPEIAGTSAEDVNNYRDLLQNFYNNQQAAIIGVSGDNNGSGESGGNTGEIDNEVQDKLFDDVNKVVQNTLDTPGGQENANAVKLAQMGFCMANGCYQQAVDAAQGIDVTKYTPEQRNSYYNILANCYYWLGDKDKAAEYFNMPYEETEN